MGKAHTHSETTQQRRNRFVSAGTLPASVPDKRFFWATLAIVLIGIIIRIRLLHIPLERDEGEYAYMGRLLLQGIMPYTGAYSMKLPGTALMYAVIMLLLGKSVAGIHLGLLIVNSATTLLFFTAFRKLFSAQIAFVAASGYCLMSLSPATYGFAAHATQFVTLFVAAALLALAAYEAKRQPLFSFLAGLALGMSVLMKQQALFFALFGGLWWATDAIWKRSAVHHVLLYGAGLLLPYALVLLWVYGSGGWDAFVFWTITYARTYAAGTTLDRGAELFRMAFVPMFREYFLLWLLFLAGTVLVFYSGLSRRQKVLTLAFAVAAFLTVCPGLYFRNHYFITFLPAVSLLAGIAVSFLARGRQSSAAGFLLPAGIVGLSLVIALVQHSWYYLDEDPETISRTIYGTNPFTESAEIGSYISRHASPGEKIAVLGSEPQIYFYAQRRAATGYLYTYGLMEEQPYSKRMQVAMQQEIEQAKPAYLVFCKVDLSWLVQPQSAQDIFSWFFKYSRAHYDLVGAGDVQADMPTRLVWDEAVQSYAPKSGEFILIFKRKAGSPQR